MLILVLLLLSRYRGSGIRRANSSTRSRCSGRTDGWRGQDAVGTVYPSDPQESPRFQAVVMSVALQQFGSLLIRTNRYLAADAHAAVCVPYARKTQHTPQAAAWRQRGRGLRVRDGAIRRADSSSR
ncbi:hypothetical protein cyc_03550 [Cyclospora cayetanensis]|uniref:Secreted protein n=1 Tax=Cyclospora cayetanensis TaxID=88456 RepID=A0A1D3CW10_9EIME|nr:hypothetical protein cyc_03550 [Cyclospora cayetanensis]